MDSLQKNRLKNADIMVIVGLFCIFLVSNFGPWDKFPLIYLSVIQFPSRLYVFVCFFFATAGGYYLSLICRLSSIKIMVFGFLSVLTFVTIVVNAGIYYDKNLDLDPKWPNVRTVLNEESHYLSSGMEYFPARMPFPDPFILNRKDSVISQTGETAISGFVRNKHITEFDVNTSVKDSLELPLIYYKGYAATLNGQDIVVTESSRGLVQIPIDRSGRVEAWYKGTFVQKLSFYITVLAILGLIAFIYIQRRKKNVLSSEEN
jgi:hypothetical protein